MNNQGNPKLDEVKTYLSNLKTAIKNKNKKEIVSLYDDHANSDIDWDDKDIIPEKYAIELDELVDLVDEVIY